MEWKKKKKGFFFVKHDKNKKTNFPLAFFVWSNKHDKKEKNVVLPWIS